MKRTSRVLFDTLWHTILHRLRLFLKIAIECWDLQAASNCGHLQRSRSPFDLHKLWKSGKISLFYFNSIIWSLSDMFSYFLLPHQSCTDIYISDLPLIMTSYDPGGRYLQNLLTSGSQNIKSMKTGHIRYQIIDFLLYRFHSETLFWPQMILEVVTSKICNYLRMSKYDPMKISLVRYQIKVNLVVFWFHSESHLWPYMILKVFDL